jgi:Domain of unknown function (DUF4337)
LTWSPATLPFCDTLEKIVGRLSWAVARKVYSLAMEANEAHELIEHHEHAAHDQSLRQIALAMSILAVLVAIITLLGHRASTEAVLAQARASDQWNEYQAKRIRQNETELALDMLSTTTVRDGAAADRLRATYQKNIDQWTGELKEESDKAREFEAEIRRAERQGDRFDLGEALLEIGLVISSISLLTKQRVYAAIGITFGVLGIISGVFGFLVA